MGCWLRFTEMKWRSEEWARNWVEQNATPGEYRVRPQPKPKGSLKHLPVVVVN